MEKEKLWTKEFVIVAMMSFLLSLIFFLLIVTIASYAVDEYNASTSTAGLVSSIFIIGSIFGRIGAGRMIGKVGPKKILFIGLIFFLITSIFYFFMFNLSTLIINRLINGIAIGIASTATGTIIAEILPDSRKGEGIGYYSLSGIFATAIGPFIGILLMNLENGFLVIFIMNAVFSVVCIAVYFLLKLDQPIHVVDSSMEVRENHWIEKFVELRAVPISFIALMIGFSYSGIMSFISFYAIEVDLVATASYFFIVYAIVVVCTRPFTGRILDMRGANIVVYPCLILFVLGMFLFSQATISWMLLLSAVLIGIGYGNFNSVAQAIAIKVTAPHRFGLAISTYFIFFDIGLGFGPYILGFFVPWIGYRGIFLCMAGLIALSIPCYYFLHGRRDRQLLSRAA